MSARVPRHVRWLVRSAAFLVPSYRRAAWRRQWTADLEHLCAHERGGGRVLRFALGSVRHALFLRMREMTMRGFVGDLRQASRAILHRPGFTLLAVSTLAIGIGAATAIFSFAEAMILRPLPLPEEDRLVRMFSANPSRGMGSFSVSWPDYIDLAEESGLFEAATFYQEREADVSGGADPERIRTVSVHEDFFQTLGSRLALGRGFQVDDHAASAGPTVVLAEEFWARRFGSDATVVGRTVRLDGVPHTVVGVLAAGQGWPVRAHAWVPLRWGGTAPDWAAPRSNHTWQVVGRLAADLDVRAASQQVREMARALYAADGVSEREAGIEAYLMSLRASSGGESAVPIFATLGTAVFFVLLIACMNASGLLLTRAWTRARELSVRAALGAGRLRLVLALMAESVVLAILGGAAGVWLGQWAIREGLSASPPELAISDIRLNTTVLTAALAVSLLAAVLSGLLPALRATRGSLAEALKEGSGQTGAGRGSVRFRQTLIVAEIALSLALLVGAGLTVRGFQRQLAADPGFDEEGIVTFSVRLPGARYGSSELVDGYYGRAVEALERHPAVRSATATSRLPLGGTGTSLYRSFVFDGATPPPEGDEYGAMWVEIDPTYFETMGVRPLRGRTISAEDDGTAPAVAMVSERMADLMSPGEPMTGRVIRSFWDENLPRTVVGVLPDIQYNGVARAQVQPVVFVPRAQSTRLEMTFMVRTAGDPREMLSAVRSTMTDLDPDVALDALMPLTEAHAADLAGIRFLTSLFAAFGTLALVLAVSGVYGLVSYTVSLRRREVGLRMAMGATTGTVQRAVLRESAVLAVAGLSIGLLLAYAGARVLAAGMSGIAIIEPSTFVGVALVLAASVVAASWVPATRASRVDPSDALRAD